MSSTSIIATKSSDLNLYSNLENMPNKTRTSKEFSLFNVESNFLIFTNYLTNTVVIKQLYKLLNSSPNAKITKHLTTYKIMTNFQSVIRY